MTGDRVQREAELLAQAVARRRAARAHARDIVGAPSSPTGERGAEHRADTDPGATGWSDLLAGAALAARGGLDLVGGAVTRWVDATGGPGRHAESASPDDLHDESPPGFWAYHRAERREIPVSDWDDATPEGCAEAAPGPGVPGDRA